MKGIELGNRALTPVFPDDFGTAARYAEGLLASLGLPRRVDAPRAHPAVSWARSGSMELTGDPLGPARMCPAPLAACADGALAALAAIAPEDALDGLTGSQLLAERAAITGHARNGAISPGGRCHLLAAASGGIALNLAREEDWQLLPAWLEEEGPFDWARIAAEVATRPAKELVERGRLLGLAVTRDPDPRGAGSWFCELAPAGLRRQRSRPPRVIDLSSLWAGPLCGHLLARLGCEVIKVESRARPDGARQGPATFFDLLNAGKSSVALDFHADAGRAQLRALLATADIVIEGSRPRALVQLGVDARELVARHAGLTWISITGYGRGLPQEEWIAYGDDAGVAAGLSALMREATGRDLIVGDAIADPLTGLHAALAAWATHRLGGGRLLSVALSDVVRHCLAFEPAADARGRAEAWTAIARHAGPPRRPQARAVSAFAPPLGADTDRVLRGAGKVVRLREAPKRARRNTARTP